jgi:hypothetical protein
MSLRGETRPERPEGERARPRLASGARVSDSVDGHEAAPRVPRPLSKLLQKGHQPRERDPPPAALFLKLFLRPSCSLWGRACAAFFAC